MTNNNNPAENDMYPDRVLSLIRYIKVIAIKNNSEYFKNGLSYLKYKNINTNITAAQYPDSKILSPVRPENRFGLFNKIFFIKPYNGTMNKNSEITKEIFLAFDIFFKSAFNIIKPVIIDKRERI